MIPATPTSEYIILEMTSLIGLKMKATRLKLNKPINPQFKAPIITTTNAIFCKTFIILFLLISYYYINLKNYTFS